MTFRLSRASGRALSILSALGAATIAVAAFGVGSGQAQQAPANGGLVNPPGVSISQEPLNTNPDTWVGCHHVAKGGPDGVPGMLCAPSIQTGTPAIQEKLRAQRDAYLAANPQAAGRGRGGAGTPQPQIPMPCGVNPDAPPAPAAAAGRGPARQPQGGHGKIRVAFISHGHEYEREPMALMLDCLGDDITYSRIDYPAAEYMLTPEMAKHFDVYVFYDLGGPGVVVTNPDGSRNRFYPDPSPSLKKSFAAMAKAGKGMVFIHHAAAAWAHTWPEYSEVVGGACDWYAPVTVRGILDPHHGYYGGTQQHLTVVDKSSPITAHLGDGFDVTDEAYACAWFPDSVHPLLTTSFAPPDPLVNLNPKRQFSNLAAWYKASENSPVFYTQVGHDHSPWQVAQYQQLIRNAIKWAASKEALDWAKKNHTTIFK